MLLGDTVVASSNRDLSLLMRQDQKSRHERVLMVQQRGAAVATSPFRRAQGVGSADPEVVEGSGKGMRVEAPTVRWLWDE